jgi:hypothetical protein
MEEEEREEERWRGPEGTYSLGIVCGDLGLGAARRNTHPAKRWAFVAYLETRCFTLVARRAQATCLGCLAIRVPDWPAATLAKE